MMTKIISHITCGTPDSATILSYSFFSCGAVSGMEVFGPTRGVCIRGGNDVNLTIGSSRVRLVANFLSLICGRFSKTPARCSIFHKTKKRGCEISSLYILSSR